jgi:uncharacterized protein YbcV (DUF1398 family)
MEMVNKINEAYNAAKNYPDLVSKLIALVIVSYTVDVATRIILYRFADGETVIHQNENPIMAIADKFDEILTIKAIRDNQQGKSDYPAFINDIAKAGVRFYEATLNGPNKRVTYIGSGGLYEEKIPL